MNAKPAIERCVPLFSSGGSSIPLKISHITSFGMNSRFGHAVSSLLATINRGTFGAPASVFDSTSPMAPLYLLDDIAENSHDSAQMNLTFTVRHRLQRATSAGAWIINRSEDAQYALN